MARRQAAGAFWCLAWMGAAHGADVMTCSNSHFRALVVPQSNGHSTLLHTPTSPQGNSGLVPEISAEELQEVHQRVMGRHARAYREVLPSLDVFAPHPPSGVFVALLDGVSATTPYIERLQAVEGIYEARVAGFKDLHAVATSYGNSSRPYPPSSLVACLACDPATRALPVCQQAAKNRVSEDPLLHKIDLAFIAKELPGLVSPTDLGKTFEMGGVADRRFLAEVQSLLRLPFLLPGKPGAQGNGPDVILYAADGLRGLEVAYGVSSPQVSLAGRMMDKALDQTSRALERRYAAEGGLISQVLLRQTGALVEVARPRRRLQPTGEDATPVTEEDIFNVNIITWTTVGLILALLMSLCLLAGAGSGPKDSLLYAKFAADTSGGKTD
ncbi:hypothetical protein Naga_100304g5 [Nannochloropsis gaditana]|uniref:Uncharacterized protein n=1 Tax=Nannochloropsis gaditana TaxID=72520 RepID=W7U2R1_9STRA|nr:hypothetical protein Naga_100304g5 [Nannochloropsis gaditana]